LSKGHSFAVDKYMTYLETIENCYEEVDFFDSLLTMYREKRD